MVKKLLSASAVAALVLAACSTEDPVSPAPFSPTNSSASNQDLLSSGSNIAGFNISSSSAVYKNDTFFI